MNKGTIIFFLMFIMALLLCGCAKKTQTEQIIDTHIEHINQVVDYAKNNFDQNAEVLTLENELSNCGMVLEDIKASHKIEIKACESETNYWRLSTISLLGLILGLFLLKIRRVL